VHHFVLALHRPVNPGSKVKAMDSTNPNRELIVRLAGMLAPPPGEVIRQAGYPPEADRPATLAKARPSRRDWSALRRPLRRAPSPLERRTFTRSYREQVMIYVRRRATWLPA